MAGEKKSVTLLTNRRIRVEISRQVDYAKTKINFFCEGDLPDKSDLTEVVQQISEELEELAEDRISIYEEGGAEDEVEETQDDQKVEDGIEDTPEEEKIDPPEDDENSDPENPPEEEAEELDITEDQINEMSKKECIALCQGTEGMESIDLTTNLKPMRACIIDLLFEEEEEADAGDEVDTGEEGAELDPELDESSEWAEDDWEDKEE